MDTIKINNKNNTKIIAHRGYSKYNTENTIDAFNFAGNTSCYGIEADVRKSADGVFFISHDSNSNRLTNIDKDLTTLSIKEIKELNLKDIKGNISNNIHYSTYDEYLSSLKNSNKVAVIETKELSEEDSVKIADMALSYLPKEKLTFISFDKNSCIAIKKKYPDIVVQFLSYNFDPELMLFLLINKLDLDINYQALTKERINALHDVGIKVNAWTVNELDIAELLVYWNIDYITSDTIE